MKVLFYIGHPAHYHYANALAEIYSREGISIHFALRDKDIVLDLMKDSPWDNTIVSDERFSWKPINLLFRWMKMFALCLKIKPSFVIGTDFIIAQVGRVLGIPSFIVFDDDEELIPQFSKLAFPFASVLIAPLYCKVLTYRNKLISYPGFHKSVYMKSIGIANASENKSVFILRFVSLNAHHDAGVKGIGNELALRIISHLTQYGQVIISSERPLIPELEIYRKAIESHEMHDLMKKATLLISDSQSMSVEAAMIGLPSIRINDFAGRIGVLNALEKEYGLTYSFLPSEESKIFECISEVLDVARINPNHWKNKVVSMQREQIDFGALMLYLVKFYPKSINQVRNGNSLSSLVERASIKREM